VSLEVELDNSLMDTPERLREKISRLFAMVRQSLKEEIEGDGHGAPGGKVVEKIESHDKRGQTLEEALTEQGKLLSAKQAKFLEVLAYKQRRKLDQECKERFGKVLLALTSQEASVLIKEWSNSLISTR